MPSWKKVIVSGSDAALNSLTVSNGITGSLFGTSSFALTASYAANANIDTSSFATTGSNIFIGDQTITGSLFTSKLVGTGSIYLQPNQDDVRYLEIYNTSPTDTHITASGGQLFIGDDTTYVKVDNYGSVKRIDIVADNGVNISGSVQITGSLDITDSITGSLFGTASYAVQAATASYFITSSVTSASYALNADTASYFITSSVTSASYAESASYALNADTASYFVTSSVTSASFAESASFALTASYAANANIDTSSFATTGSNIFRGNQTISGSINFGNGSTIQSVPTSSGDGGGYTTLVLTPDASILSDQYIVLDPTTPNHIHIRAGGIIDSSSAYLYLGGEKANVVVQNLDNSFDEKYWVQINSQTGSTQNTWTFDDNGTLIVPGNVVGAENLATTGSNQFDGNQIITGSLTVTYPITGSLFGTASYALNASTASYFLTSSVTSASYAESASYAATSSYADNFTVANQLTATTLIVQTISSSVVYSSGSNIFGNDLSNTQQFTGSVTITGSLAVNNSSVILTNQTSSMTVLSASYALTASYFVTSSVTSASYALNADTASYFFTSSVTSASYALNADTASYFVTSSVTSASYADQALTASYALTSSYSDNINGTTNHIPVFDSPNSLVTSSIYQSGGFSIIINQDNNTSAAPEALYVWQPSTESFNVISGKGNLNSYLQLNIQNLNNGNSASSDVVATANNGSETTNYIDMGINGGNFTGLLGGPNDAYLYSTGVHLHIGNASNEYVGFFAGGDDVDANMKLLLAPNNQHEMTGSLDISGSLIVQDGITGSLLGTASFALDALSSSYAFDSTTASFALNLNPNATASYAISASQAITSSYAQNAISASYSNSASYAATSSYADNFTVAGTLTAQTLNVQVITSSTEYVTGSTIFGSQLSNTHQFTGSVTITGSLAVNDSNVVLSNQTSSMSVLSASYASTASSADIFIVRTALTASGLNYPTADGAYEFQVLQTNAAGNLSFGDVLTTFDTVYNAEVTTLIKGTPVYVSGSQGANPKVYRADAADPAKMPVVYIISEAITAGSTGRGITLGEIDGIDLTGYTAGTSVYVAPGGGWTSTRPTGSNVTIQFLGLVTKEGNGGKGLVLNPGPATLPNIQSGYVWMGDNNSYPTPISTSSLFVASASYALTASYAANTSPFPYTGSAIITGSLEVIGNTVLTGSINISGSQTFVGVNTITGSVNISGSTIQVGNNTLLGNTILTGSITISGSFPIGSLSSSVKVYGDTSMTGYLKFEPYSTNIDTNISASYIFVSGSTNDLYFSQNANGYNNVTRLRWIEGNMYTGLLNGGIITSQSSTVYQVGSGSGIIVSLNASLNDNPYPTIQYLNWGNLSQSIAPLSASYDQAFVGIGPNGQIYQQGTPFYDGQFDTLINIGLVLFQNRSTINGFKTQPSVAYGFEQSQNTFNRAFGPLKLSGFTLAPSGSSTGSLVIGSGTAYAPGSNYIIDPNNPSYAIDPGTNVSKIWRYYQSGSDWVYLTNGGAGYTTIDPRNYSNNGTLSTVANGEWSIQRCFWFPNSASKAIIVYYGNAIYDTELEAIANINVESFIEAPNTAANAIYLGAIIIKGNGVFTAATDYKITPGGLFRNVGGSGGGGSVVTQTLAGLSDVAIGGMTNLQPLVYSTTAGKWINSSTISGSLYGNAQTATSASYAFDATSASYALTASYSLNVPVTASYAISASQAVNADNAVTASYVLNAVSSSFATSASYALTASYAANATNTISSSYAATSSYADNFTVADTLTATTLIVQTISSSVVYSSGSNIFGNQLTNTQVFTGSVSITGSFVVNGPATINNLTGSLFGTASYAINALSSSYTISSSYALSASQATNAITASYILNAVSSSYALSSSYAASSSFATTASYFLTSSVTSASFATSASYALSASQATNAVTASYVLNAVSSSYASFALSASQATNANTAVSSSYAATSSYAGNFTIANHFTFNTTFNDYATIASTITGTNNLFTQATGSFTSAFFKYTVKNSTNSRTGEVMAIWNGASVEFTDVSTRDLGSTSPVTMSVILVGSDVEFNAITNTSGWSVKSLATFM